MEILRDPTAEISSFTPRQSDATDENVCFLGLRFDTGSIDEAARSILAATHGRLVYVTPNVHHMVRMLEDPATLQPLYEGAWRVFCDSQVLSRLAGAVVLRFRSLLGVILPPILLHAPQSMASRLQSSVRQLWPALDCKISILASALSLILLRWNS